MLLRLLRMFGFGRTKRQTLVVLWRVYHNRKWETNCHDTVREYLDRGWSVVAAYPSGITPDGMTVHLCLLEKYE